MLNGHDQCHAMVIEWPFQSLQSQERFVYAKSLSSTPNLNPGRFSEALHNYGSLLLLLGGTFIYLKQQELNVVEHSDTHLVMLV